MNQKEAVETASNLKEIPCLQTTKNSSKTKKQNIITLARTNTQNSCTPLEWLKVTIQKYPLENNELEKKLQQVLGEILRASLPISRKGNNDFKSQ